MTSLVVTISVGLTFFNKAKKEYDAFISRIRAKWTPFCASFPRT